MKKKLFSSYLCWFNFFWIYGDKGRIEMMEKEREMWCDDIKMMLKSGEGKMVGIKA